MIDLNAERELRSSIELFYYAYRAFTSGPDHILERRGLARVHHRILYFVGRNPAITVNSLLATLRVSKQALNAPLRQLLAMKLIAASIPRDERVTVRSPGHAQNRAVERNRGQRLPGLEVPDGHALVVGTSGDVPPVGAHRHAPHPGLVPGEFTEAFAGGQVPDRRGAVIGAGHRVPPVGAHRH